MEGQDAEIIPMPHDYIDLFFEGEFMYIGVDEWEVRLDKKAAMQMAEAILEWPSNTIKE